MFCFHVAEMKSNLFGKRTKIRGTPFGYVVVSELKAWRIELEERAKAQGLVTEEELEGSEPDWRGDFLEWHSKWRKKRQRKEKEQ